MSTYSVDQIIDHIVNEVLKEFPLDPFEAAGKVFLISATMTVNADWPPEIAQRICQGVLRKLAAASAKQKGLAKVSTHPKNKFRTLSP